MHKLTFSCFRLNAKSQVLTNFEVMSALREIKDQKLSHGSRNLATITYEVSTRYTQERLALLMKCFLF